MSIKLYLANEQRERDAYADDVSSLDGLVKALYESISFKLGGMPQLDRLISLFAPGAVLINATSEDCGIMDVETFTRRFQEVVELGILIRFEEHEIARQTQEFGNIIHMFSSYAARGESRDGIREVRGMNSIQVINNEHRYHIACIAWDDEREGLRLPAKYL
jgi:hypothetical protein